MIVKSAHVRASRVRQEKASSALKSHLKYLQYRERDPQTETKEDRYLFSKDSDHVDRRAIHDDIMRERAGNIYYHRIIFSPSQQEPVTDWHAWTRAVMRDLEDRLGKDLDWCAAHHQNTDDPHVHVVLRGTGTNRETGETEPVSFNAQDFAFMRQCGREHSEYDYYRLVREKFDELDQRDTTTQENEYERPNQEQELSLQSIER